MRASKIPATCKFCGKVGPRRGKPALREGWISPLSADRVYPTWICPDHAETWWQLQASLTKRERAAPKLIGHLPIIGSGPRFGK